MNDRLINTLEAPGEFDALMTLRPGEPYFLLVGRDRSAPRLIDEWADQNRRRALAEYEAGLITREKRDDELRKATQAEMIASSMVEYKNGWVAKHESAPEEKPTTYSGHVLPEDTKRRDAIQSARVRAATAVNNAAAAISSLAELLGEPETPDRNPTLRALVDLSDEIMPPRPMPGSAPLLESAGG